MKKLLRIRLFLRTSLLAAFCIPLLFLGMTAPAFAASTPAPKPVPPVQPAQPALACLLGGEVITLSQRSVSFGSTTLMVRLQGIYNGQGEYCGKMRAEAVISSSSGTLTGSLTAILRDCTGPTNTGNIIAVEQKVLQDSGFTTIDTSREKLACGQAEARFDNFIVAVHGDVFSAVIFG